MKKIKSIVNKINVETNELVLSGKVEFTTNKNELKFVNITKQNYRDLQNISVLNNNLKVKIDKTLCVNKESIWGFELFFTINDFLDLDTKKGKNKDYIRVQVLGNMVCNVVLEYLKKNKLM